MEEKQILSLLVAEPAAQTCQNETNKENLNLFQGTSIFCPVTNSQQYVADQPDQVNLEEIFSTGQLFRDEDHPAFINNPLDTGNFKFDKIMEEEHEESSYSVNLVNKINEKHEDANSLPILQND